MLSMVFRNWTARNLLIDRFRLKLTNLFKLLSNKGVS